MNLGHIVVALTLAAAPAAFGQGPASFHTLSSEAFASAPGDTMLVDVREPAEWSQTGAPEGAKLISNSREDFVAAVLAELDGDKSKPVAVICRSGGRSVQAAQKLTEAGFTNVTNIGDGMIGRDSVGKGWQAAELPLTPYTCETC